MSQFLFAAFAAPRSAPPSQSSRQPIFAASSSLLAMAAAVLVGGFGGGPAAATAGEGKPAGMPLNANGFTNVAAERGLAPIVAGEGYGRGVAVADVDNDGDADIFLAAAPGHADRLYINDGLGFFQDVAPAAGLASMAGSRAPLFVDFSGDGRLDLVIGEDCFDSVVGDPCLERFTLRFMRQDAGGQFVDVTATMQASGVGEDGIDAPGDHRSGLVAGDLNRDGWMDIVGGIWRGPALVLQSDAAGGLVDVAPAHGMADASFHHWQPAIVDIDRDGWPDISWAIDFTENRLWRNQLAVADGGPGFVDVAVDLGVDNAMNDMGHAIGDLDGDGDFELFFSEIFIEGKPFHNVLQWNESAGREPAFTERAVELGLEHAGFGWGATFLDVDNDRRLDLAVTNGWFNGVGYDDTTRLFMPDDAQPGRFVDRAAEYGLADDAWGASLVAFDMDRDGDLDLLQTVRGGNGVRLLENQGSAADAGWLAVRPRVSAIEAGAATGATMPAIGAEVEVIAGGDLLLRRISAGTGHMSQEPAEAFVGLGGAPTIDRVVVRFADGARTILRDVAPDQVLTVHRSPCAGRVDQDGDGAVGFDDLLLVLGEWGPCRDQCAGDVNEDAAVTSADVVALVTGWGSCGAP
ncbi:MAG: CRTAC1 family protein [Phycisphaerales bacterium]